MRGCLRCAKLFYIKNRNAKNPDKIMAKKSEKKTENKEKEVVVPEAEEVKAEEVQEPCELEKALAAAEDYKRKWYSVSAEYDNFRKRNALAVANAYRDGAAEAVLKLLPVADNFGYALDSAQDEKTRAGIDKIIKSFATILQSLGIEEIPLSAGDPFDESIAEAVMNSPCEEGEVPNTVKFILKKGYKSGDKVIRYAQVAVTV